MKSFEQYIAEAKRWTLDKLQVGDIVTYKDGSQAEVMTHETSKNNSNYFDIRMKDIKTGYEFAHQNKKPGRTTGSSTITKVVRNGEVSSRLEEARRFTPSGTFQFPSANQAKDFMSDISREGRGNIQTQHRFEQGYGRKNIIDVKWTGTMDRVVYDVLRKYNGRAWTQG